MAENPFARKSALGRWATGNPEDDLHTEPGRPKLARRADEEGRRAVEKDYKLSEDEKTAALAKYKVGMKVKASGYAGGVIKLGQVGTVTKVERTMAGAFRYTVDFGKDGYAKVLEASLQRA